MNLLFWKIKLPFFKEKDENLWTLARMEEKVQRNWRSNHKNPLSPLTNNLPSWFKNSRTENARFMYSRKRNGQGSFVWVEGIYKSDWNTQFGYDLYWLGGEFQGVNFSGRWQSGTFKGHHFNGAWMSGTFEGLTFTGLWYGGSFRKGNCSCTQWLAGSFFGSNFENGKWYGGQFYGKLFKESIFFQGTFGHNISAQFVNSTFISGIFNGTFVSGTFTDRHEHFVHFSSSIGWESTEMDKKLTIALIAGICFDKDGYATAYRKTRKEGRGCYNREYIQKEGEFEIMNASPEGHGTCNPGIHVCSPLLALHYFKPSAEDILWEVKFHKDDLLDCDGQKARLRKGTAKQIPWSFLTPNHPILKPEEAT